MLVHIVDISGSEGRDPKEDFEIINKELAVFNPELIGIDTRTEGWESIIAAENREIAERHEKSGRLVRTMVSKFVGSEKSPTEIRPKTKGKNHSILGKALSAIRAITRKRGSGDIKVDDYIELAVDDVETPALPSPDGAVPEEHAPATANAPETQETEFITVLDEDGEVCVVPATDTEAPQE